MDIVRDWIVARGIVLPEGAFELMEGFRDRVLETNRVMNLTRITGEAEFALRHFVDSLSLLPFLPPVGEISLLDVGTGAGFPGVPLKIARPDITLTLLDATRKRLDFLQKSLAELGIPALIIHARAEELPRLQPTLQYNIITARAVARLDKLAQYTLPLLAPKGFLLAMKGPNTTEEVNQARPTIKRHQAKITSITKIPLTPTQTHTLIKITKN